VAAPGRIHTALIGAVIGYALGHWLGNFIGQRLPAGAAVRRQRLPDRARLRLRHPRLADRARRLQRPGPADARPAVSRRDHGKGHVVGLAKYFRYTLDHKVVGIQYLVGMIDLLLTGGLFAMAIRTELLSPSYHLISPSTYLEVVGEHGTMMMMMMTSVILGPFGNYLVPLMIGSKRVAFPRIEALSFWLTPCAFLILLSSLLLGGFPTGWTGYAPLSIQAGEGMDSYAVAFGLMGISIILAGFNIVVTIICYRAPGMRWSRLPMFVWAMLTTGFLLVLAAPVLVGGMYMIITDRTAQTAFFVNQLGGSSYLYEDLFWFFGHPEVYILALPGFGIVSRDHPGVLPEAAVRLQDRRGGHARRGDPVLLRLAAPPVRLRHGPGHAAAVHADHRADLDPDRVHLPGRDGHLLEGEDPADRADAVRPRLLTSTS
jgi:cytochrome c oxidase subunit 1